MHSKSMEKVETIADNPIGLFGIRYEDKYYDVFYKHISSIPQSGNENKGINLFGIQGKYSYKFADVYLGLAYHNEDFDGEFYSEQFTKYVYKSGLRFNYGSTRLFVEYIRSSETRKARLFMYGVEVLFKPEDLTW